MHSPVREFGISVKCSVLESGIITLETFFIRKKPQAENVVVAAISRTPLSRRTDGLHANHEAYSVHEHPVIRGSNIYTFFFSSRAYAFE